MAAGMARKIILTVITIFLFAQVQPAYAADEPTSQAQEPAYEKVIAHGGGSFQGYETTNSVEAVNNAIANGFKIIELDMDLSEDNKIIMLHDWDRTARNYFGDVFPKKLSQSQFSRLTVYGRFEVLTIEKLATILEKHREIRIVTDTKGDNIRLLTAISEQYPKLADRFIPQIYDYDQWSKVKELGFTDVIFTMYAMADPVLEKLASFVTEHNIYAVTMPDYFAERGYCSQLSRKGITVYVHPVSSYEDAQRFFRMGAYGVYSGYLLPEEFSGFEKDCYLTVSNQGGMAVKLADERIGSLKDLKLQGQKAGYTVFFSLDRSGRHADDLALADLSPGKHRLTVNITEGKTVKGTLDYFLLKEADHYRIVHKKYEYRLDAVKQEKDFHAAINGESISAEAAGILEHSLIAKMGEYTYYCNGTPENYRNGEELLAVQKTSLGSLLPLSDTLRKLGAASVAMGKDRDITIEYGGEKYWIMADTGILRSGFTVTRLDYPVALYLNRAMAPGDFFRLITGREAIEKEGIMVLLPEGANPDKDLKEQLFKAAGKLY